MVEVALVMTSVSNVEVTFTLVGCVVGVLTLPSMNACVEGVTNARATDPPAAVEPPAVPSAVVVTYVVLLADTLRAPATERVADPVMSAIAWLLTTDRAKAPARLTLLSPWLLLAPTPVIWSCVPESFWVEP